MNRREKEKSKARRTNAGEWAKTQEKGQFESYSLKLPEGVEIYKLEPGIHAVDFMPYWAGKGNPRADEGFEHFEREWESHWVPTPNGKGIRCACLWKCFQKKCPVCTWVNKNGSADPDLLKQLKPQVRHLWVVNDKPGDAKNKFKVLDTNHYNRGSGFGEMMADLIKSDVGRYENFSALVGGMQVRLTVKEQSFAGNKYNAVTRIDFVARDYDYPESLIEKTPILDDCIVCYEFGQVWKLLEQEDSEVGGEEDAPKKRRQIVDEEDEVKPKIKDEDDDSTDEGKPMKSRSGKTFRTAKEFGIKQGMVVTYKGEEYDVMKVSPDGTSLTLEDDEGDVTTGIGPEEVTLKTKGRDEADDEDEDKDDEKVTRAKKAPVKDDEDEDEEEEDEDDEDDGTDDDEDLDEEEEDEDDEDEDEDDEELDEDKPRKKVTKPAKAKKGKR